MPSKKLPLERNADVETDPASGTTIHRTVYQRGLLREEVRDYEDSSAALLAFSNVVPKGFEELRSRARAVLREAQLPTDEDKGELRITRWDDGSGGRRRFSFKDWATLVEERSEPLSPERYAMRLIKAINAVLQKTSDQDTLMNIWLLVRAAHHFEMTALRINEAAVSGQRAERGRHQGPQARVTSGNRKKAIVRQVAEAYWKRTPVHRNNLAQTANAVSDEVNLRLEAEGLAVGKKRLLSYLRDARDSAGHCG